MLVSDCHFNLSHSIWGGPSTSIWMCVEVVARPSIVVTHSSWSLGTGMVRMWEQFIFAPWLLKHMWSVGARGCQEVIAISAQAKWEGGPSCIEGMFVEVKAWSLGTGMERMWQHTLLLLVSCLLKHMAVGARRCCRNRKRLPFQLKPQILGRPFQH